MEKKVALVTGSAKGIGAAIIKKFANNNYYVIIHYNHSEKEAKVLEQFIKQEYKTKCISIKCDLTKDEEIKKMISKIIQNFGHIDILVNNASLELNSNFIEKTKDMFIKTLDTNVVGPFLLCKYISEYMLEKKYGKIVNISSDNAINKYDPNTLEYDASKSALISLTHNLALQLAPYINVNCIAPGWVMTEKVKELNDSLDGMLEIQEKRKILIDRFIFPEEIAEIVFFLCSDKARSINNQVIVVDGGQI